MCPRRGALQILYLQVSACSKGFLFSGSQTSTHGNFRFLTRFQTLHLGFQKEPGHVYHR